MVCFGSVCKHNVFATLLQHFRNLGRFQTVTEIDKILYFESSESEK